MGSDKFYTIDEVLHAVGLKRNTFDFHKRKKYIPEPTQWCARLVYNQRDFDEIRRYFANRNKFQRHAKKEVV
ncbi:hypothetical protein TA3x_004255 [Tundrisphaera sp. TA3]|uniref:hypothetical protein n=1 Tax=Tundrisphaera sp. TA3 TaxID=3435775 RepID=UPI003EC1399D